MKLYFLMFFVSFSSFLFGQSDIKVADVANTKYAFLPFKYGFELDGNHYFQTMKLSTIMVHESLTSDDIGIIAFNKDLKEVKKIQLGDKKNRYIVLESFFYQGNIYILGFRKVKDERVVSLYIYDSDGKLKEEKQVLKTDKDNTIEVLASADSSKIAVFTKLDEDSKKSDCKMEACVLNRTGSVLWSDTIALKSNSNDFGFHLVALDNKGSLYTIMVNYLKDDKYNFFMHILNSAKSNKIQLLAQEFIGMLGMYEAKTGFYLTGFNLNIKKDIFQSHFIVKIDEQATKITIPNNPIPLSILEPLIKSKYYKEKNGWPSLKLQHGWHNANGELNIVYEKTEVENLNASMNYKTPLMFRKIEFKDYYFFAYNTDGTLKSINVSPKDVRKNAEETLIPKSNFVFENNLYMVYNEVEKNINIAPFGDYKSIGTTVPILRKFSPDGTIKDIILSNNLKDRFVMPNTARITADGNFIFISTDSPIYRAKDVKIGLMKFNSK